MMMLTENLAKSIIEERQRQATRMANATKAIRIAKERRRAESQKVRPGMSFLQSLRNFTGQIRYGAYLPNALTHSEQNPDHAEKPGSSPEELEKDRIYERIAQGNALVEAEYRSRKLREGR